MILLDTAKIRTLKTNGSFNRHATAVLSALFKDNTAFDPYDLVQVKYEMLRAVKLNEMTVSEAAKQFGFSRTAYYKIDKSFESAGVDGLYLKKTGPKTPAKITEDVLQFINEIKNKHPKITNDRIVQELQTQKGISLHKRSIQRVLSKPKKKRI